MRQLVIASVSIFMLTFGSLSQADPPRTEHTLEEALNPKDTSILQEVQNNAAAIAALRAELAELKRLQECGNSASVTQRALEMTARLQRSDNHGSRIAVTWRAFTPGTSLTRMDNLSNSQNLVFTSPAMSTQMASGFTPRVSSFVANVAPISNQFMSFTAPQDFTVTPQTQMFMTPQFRGATSFNMFQSPMVTPGSFMTNQRVVNQSFSNQAAQALSNQVLMNQGLVGQGAYRSQVQYYVYP
jgi:hypothetical protein